MNRPRIAWGEGEDLEKVIYYQNKMIYTKNRLITDLQDKVAYLETLLPKNKNYKGKYSPKTLTERF